MNERHEKEKWIGNKKGIERKGKENELNGNERTDERAGGDRQDQNE